MFGGNRLLEKSFEIRVVAAVRLGSVSLIPYGMHAYIILNLVTNELVCQSKIEDEEEALLKEAGNPQVNAFHFRSYPVANQGSESDDCERMNAYASDAMESAAKSV